MKKIAYIAACAIVVSGCANGQGRGANNKLIRENEQRIASLEESVTALNSQIAQLNNRVYEVRTKAGGKTNMRVVPVQTIPSAAPTPVQPATKAPEGAVEPASLPVASAPATVPDAASAPVLVPAPAPAAPKQPVGRKIDPKSKPRAMPAKAVNAPAAPAPAIAPAPANGSIGNQEGDPLTPLDEISLPPADLPPVPTGNVPDAATAPTGGVEVRSPVSPQPAPAQPNAGSTPAIPLPIAPVSDLSLPPEDAQAPADGEGRRAAWASGEAQAAVLPAEERQHAATPARPQRSAPKGEQAAYNAALNAARSGRTAEGIRLFRDFLQKYPNGPYAANAEYWIGECLYSQGKYQDALSEFQNVNSAYPRHHKNADALLKAGITMSKMGDKAGAAEKFRTLIANFPNSEAAKRARALGAH